MSPSPTGVSEPAEGRCFTPPRPRALGTSVRLYAGRVLVAVPCLSHSGPTLCAWGLLFAAFPPLTTPGNVERD